jgi:hypothetical protein
MQQSRREFMRNVGVVLAAAMLSGCKSFNLPWSGGDKDDWDRLRDAWTGLDDLARDAKDMDRGEKTRDKLVADHRAALDALVNAGELGSAPADDMHVAFFAAAQHVWRANAPITCYLPMPEPDYRISSASDLASQAEALAELAGRSGIDPATVASAQAAIERDVAFLSMPDEAREALMDSLRQAAGDTWNWPQLEQLDVDVPPESAQAALTLADLLLGKK